jgi:DNA-binding NarL/FixJ family response regulator
MINLNYTIAIVDDHKLILSGVSHIIQLNQLGDVVAELNNGNQLLRFLQKNTVDLIILDINMPEMNGIEALQKTVDLYPQSAILLLSQYENMELIKKIKTIGAKGFLSKNFEVSHLISAITTIKNNQTFFPALDNEVAILKINKYHLTLREIEVLNQIVLGKKNKQIATELFLSEYTIETHRKNIIRKLETTSIVEMMNIAKNLGYIYF